MNLSCVTPLMPKESLSPCPERGAALGQSSRQGEEDSGDEGRGCTRLCPALGAGGFLPPCLQLSPSRRLGLDHPQECSGCCRELPCLLCLQEFTLPCLGKAGIKADSSLLLLNFPSAPRQLLLSIKSHHELLTGSPRRREVGEGPMASEGPIMEGERT